MLSPVCNDKTTDGNKQIVLLSTISIKNMGLNGNKYHFVFQKSKIMIIWDHKTQSKTNSMELWENL